jgi:hypothetical protein
MKHHFTRDQIKRIIIEELAKSQDEDEAIELLQQIVGLNEDETDEFEEKLRKAKAFKSRVGITLLGAVAILFGGMNALSDRQEAQVQRDVEKVQQLDAETLERFGVDTAMLDLPDNGRMLTFDDLSDLSNSEAVEMSWEQIEKMVDNGDLNYQKAKVSSMLPGGMVALTYDDIPKDLIMPLSLTTKEHYKAKIVKDVLQGKASNLKDLERYVFGDTGKWTSGSKEKKFRYHQGAQILPPEWSVAYDLYGDLVEQLVAQAASVLKDPETSQSQREQLYGYLGVSDDASANKALNDLLKRAGRQ